MGTLWALIIVAVLVIGSMVGAFLWISTVNEDQSLNNDFKIRMNDAYADCMIKYQKGSAAYNSCMDKVDEVYDKFCKDFDAC